MKVSYIYKTTNLINGKIYIGKIFRKQDCKTYLGSGVRIKRAIKRFGRENFKREILEHCSSHEELLKREIYWIEFYNSRKSNIGYNLCIGGSGGIGWRAAYSKKNREKFYSEQSRRLKKKWSDSEFRSRMIKALKDGHKKRSIEDKQEQQQARLQTMNSWSQEKKDQYRLKLSLSHIGHISSSKGIPKSEETKKKISNTLNKEIVKIDPDSNKILEVYKSRKSAQENIGIQINVKSKLKNGGFYWKYLEDLTQEEINLGYIKNKL